MVKFIIIIIIILLPGIVKWCFSLESMYQEVFPSLQDTPEYLSWLKQCRTVDDLDFSRDSSSLPSRFFRPLRTFYYYYY